MFIFESHARPTLFEKTQYDMAPEARSKRLVDGFFNLDLRADNYDLTCVFVAECHFFLSGDTATLRHADMILSQLKSQT
jgi:hypothetical protein